MTTRLKITRPALRSRAEAEAALGAIRRITIERRGLLAERDAERKALDDRYAGRLDDLAGSLDAFGEMLRAWAEAHPAEFGGRRALDLTHGLLGWRTGMPKLVKRTKEGWDLLVARVRHGLGEGYVRTKEEVDREAIIAARDTLDAARLRACGLAVVQEEAFFIEPRVDEQEATLRPEGARP